MHTAPFLNNVNMLDSISGGCAVFHYGKYIPEWYNFQGITPCLCQLHALHTPFPGGSANVSDLSLLSEASGPYFLFVHEGETTLWFLDVLVCVLTPLHTDNIRPCHHQP